MSNRPAPSPASSVALVTGASDRIGAAIAMALAAAGHAVVIHYRTNAEGARGVRDAIRRKGGRAAILKADLASRPRRAALIGKAAAPAISMRPCGTPISPSMPRRPSSSPAISPPSSLKAPWAISSISSMSAS